LYIIYGKKKSMNLRGKFIIAIDTLCEGWCCMMEGEEGQPDYKPMLFDSEDEAFAEIFDSNHSMLEGRSPEELEEYNEGVTSEMVKEMGEILNSGNVKDMRDFMEEHPECDDSGEWVEPADQFIMNRKTFLTNEGIIITGSKLFL
jgi:hypothetical protein